MFSRDTRHETRSDFPRATTSQVTPPRLSGPLGLVSGVATANRDGDERPTSILGPDISIFGQQLVLKTKGSLLIQGHIEGDVHGETVTVDEGANVKGVITARTIAIEGGVKGQLRGSNVILHEKAVVEADITQQRLTVADGAQFEGSVRKAKDDSEVMPDLA